ncbi:DUF2214 family protein [Elizabethkingia ursingii]|uniref:DUF2214 family protein n=1 Tax=Elizabethkingia ursingii TaxID=1756150 RepID=UPI000751562C|nr:DUF2214 family protein [Elizabethkingia ursingii]KUY30173.1 hypothetical protein ATB96_16560 [Elizabethkingia ursingii]
MKIKYFENILVYVSVLIVCFIIGGFARLISIEKGADEYTAKVFFWVCIGSGIIVFAILSLFLDSITRWLLRRLPNKTKFELVENIADTNVVRNIQHQKKVRQDQEKLQIALNYTKHQFALYLSDKDLDLLCKAVASYSKKEKVSDSILVETKILSSIDLYHFGWNIWNHFGGRNHLYQREISKFLENNFQKLNKYPINTIKSHLTDPDTKDTIIKLQEDLAEYK